MNEFIMLNWYHFDLNYRTLEDIKYLHYMLNYLTNSTSILTID